MTVHVKRNMEDYAQFLEDNPAEINALYKDVLIHVTSFFRDPEVFENLKCNVLPNLLKDKTLSVPFRVWVPGCSSGQEVYSLAIILLECLDNMDSPPAIQIFATDLSDSYALKKARAGIYPKSIEASMSPERLSRFFKKENGRYIINKSIREMCIFSKHNVAADPPFSKMDLISCRNLLIYFSTPLQQRIIRTFHFALNPGGSLLLGTAETIGTFTNLFSQIDKKYSIYTKTSTCIGRTIHFNATYSKTKIPVSSYIPVTSTINSHHWQEVADRIILSKYSLPGGLVNEDLDILQFRGRTSPYLEPTSGEPSYNLLRMAAEGLFIALHSSIDECRKKNITVHRKGVWIQQKGQTFEIAFYVCPVTLPDSQEKCYLILFDEYTSPITIVEQADDSISKHKDAVIQLQADLRSMHEYLQFIIEKKNLLNDDLKVSITDTLSANEELQSSNEELETAKEELQSVNDQLDDLNKELMRLNTDLQESSDYAMAIVDTVRESLIVLDKDLRVHTANQAFYNTFQATPNQTLNHFFWELGVNNWNIPELRKLLEEILPQKTTLRDFLVTSNFQEAGLKVMLLNARHIIRQSSNSSMILLAIEDITERRELEKNLESTALQLSETYRHKDQFLAILAHELRNPLAPISNALAIMSLPDTDMITINDARHTIEYQLNQLVRLVDDLLDVSRIITGKIKLRLNFVDLAHLVRYAVESSKYFIESRGHKLTISLPTEPILLKVDEMRLLQVRSNLLNNAAKYTERNGNIWLSAQYKDKDLTISVKDTGIGIDADMLPHIFDMFSQIDSSIERSQGGIGIGLALVKNIVEMYGGTVTAVSAGPGKGAEFTIWIPNIIVPEETKPSLSTEESHTLLPSKQHHKRVLVVDDNEPSAKTMGKMVESLGHKVKIAYDGITAIAVAKEFLPHVILMDIGLPIMNGYDVCRALRKEPLLKDTIIAAQTGWGQEEHLRLSKEAGFNYHFIKPVTLATLKAALNGQKSNLLDF